MENRDFKYILQDITHVYFGRELTYEDILEMEETPFKFKAIINNYFAKDASKESKMIEHLCTIKKEEFSYDVYMQLKLHVKINYLSNKKSLFGRENKHVTVNCPLDEFLADYSAKVINGEAYVEEISISKLALMAIGI